MKQICTEVSCEFFQSYEWCKAPTCPYKKGVTMTADGFWYHGNGKIGGEFYPTKPNDEERYGEYVKVVRCKDCAYATDVDEEGVYCSVNDNGFRLDDFCSLGEPIGDVEE